MEKIDIEQIDKDIQDGRFDEGELEKLPSEIYQELLLRHANRQEKKTRSKRSYEPRDWSKPPEDFFIVDLDGDTYYVIPYLMVTKTKGQVCTWGHRGIAEMFNSREKLDSFIEALAQARDEAFPE